MKIYDMKVDGLAHPLGFRMVRPRFSWKIEGPGKYQTQYRLTVRGERGETIYDSHAVASRRQNARLPVPLSPRTRYTWSVEVQTDGGGRAFSEDIFETGAGTVAGSWIAPAQASSLHPCMGKTFTVEEGAVRARLYITGMGLFVPFLNGTRVGCDHLAPGCTDYKRVKQVYTYELPVRTGENTLEVLLGNGWYCGRFAGRTEIYGSERLVIAEAEIRYADGRVQRICTDTSWTWRESCVSEDGIYDGEVQDHACGKRMGLPVRICGGEPKNCLQDRLGVSVTPHPYGGPKQILRSPHGECILDFGQNMAGYVSFTGEFVQGENLLLEYGEVLDKEGNFYNENLRTAKQRFCVRTAGGRHTYQPYFTYFGFRYVRITGFHAPERVQFTAFCIYSDMERGGRFACGNSVLKRFYENTVWGQLSNFVDIPTDCPQRDERFGWLGDAQIFAETSLLHFDCAPFWRKFLADVEVETVKFGAPPDFAPFCGEPSDSEPMVLKGSSGWADAVAVIPEQLYLATGDSRALAEQYPAALRWVRYMRSHSQAGLFTAGTRYGDWLAKDGDGLIGRTDRTLISTAFSHRCARIVRRMAQVLGYAADEYELRAWEKEVRAAWRAAYMRGGALTEKTQTACVLALRCGLLDEKEKPSAAAMLYALIRAAGGTVCTGFCGTPDLLYALSDNGYAEEALLLLLGRGRGSWLHPVLCGATTVWERTDGYDDLDGAKEMNSFNHYQGGAIASWIYTRLCGFVRTSPGGTSISFRPILSESLPEFAGSFTCANGKFAMSCTRIGGDFAVTLTVPFGCSAEWDGKLYAQGVYRRRIPGERVQADARKESI